MSILFLKNLKEEYEMSERIDYAGISKKALKGIYGASKWAFKEIFDGIVIPGLVLTAVTIPFVALAFLNGHDEEKVINFCKESEEGKIFIKRLEQLKIELKKVGEQLEKKLKRYNYISPEGFAVFFKEDYTYKELFYEYPDFYVNADNLVKDYPDVFYYEGNTFLVNEKHPNFPIAGNKVIEQYKAAERAGLTKYVDDMESIGLEIREVMKEAVNFYKKNK